MNEKEAEQLIIDHVERWSKNQISYSRSFLTASLRPLCAIEFQSELFLYCLDADFAVQLCIARDTPRHSVVAELCPQNTAVREALAWG